MVVAVAMAVVMALRRLSHRALAASAVQRQVVPFDLPADGRQGLDPTRAALDRRHFPAGGAVEVVAMAFGRGRAGGHVAVGVVVVFASGMAVGRAGQGDGDRPFEPRRQAREFHGRHLSIGLQGAELAVHRGQTEIGHRNLGQLQQFKRAKRAPTRTKCAEDGLALAGLTFHGAGSGRSVRWGWPDVTCK